VRAIIVARTGVAAGYDDSGWIVGKRNNPAACDFVLSPWKLNESVTAMKMASLRNEKSTTYEQLAIFMLRGAPEAHAAC
jgi:hypothetical protein